MRQFSAILICLVLSSPALAADKPVQTLTGKVVGVKDGDTIVILVDKTQHDIRFDGIDAPESKQAFGSKAKQILSDKIFGKTVTVEWKELDRYQREIGKVKFESRWINKEMVAEGFAWHYKQYSKDKELAKAEEDARRKKLGLWADKQQTPPWEFRREKKATAAK